MGKRLVHSPVLDKVMVYMHEPRVMGTNDRVHGFVYDYYTRPEIEKLIKELHKQLTKIP